MQLDQRERLKQVLDAYGADPQCWPAEDRAALAGLRDDPGCARLFEEARALDRLLGTATGPEQPVGAHDRLLDLIAQTPQNRPVETPGPFVRTFGVGRFATMSTLAASLAIGFYVGSLGSLDTMLINDAEVAEWSESTGTDDPFDLDSLLGTNG
jgi:hypothetical protein